MFRLSDSTRRPRMPLPRTRWVWFVVLMDCMTVVWMALLGNWLDEQPAMVRAATWDGHHRLVLALAAAALVGFAVLAPLTSGFTRATRVQEGLIAVACFGTLLAMGGVAAVALPAAVALLLTGVVLRLVR